MNEVSIDTADAADSGATALGAATATAPPALPKGYRKVAPKEATFDAQRFGLGVVTFDEPECGRYRDWIDVNDRPTPNATRGALKLRAVVRKSTGLGWPKPADPAAAWEEWFRGVSITASVALLDAAGAFLKQLDEAVAAEGNG